MSSIRVAVVGAGGIAQVVHLPELQKSADFQLVAVCDVDEKKAGFLTDKFHIPMWYHDYETMLAKEKLDAVHICTPSRYHVPMTTLALENDLHVFVETPVAFQAGEARRLAELAALKQKVLMVDMQNRFRDDIQILREFIRNDELGPLFYIKAGWLKKWNRYPEHNWHNDPKISGGGVLIDMGTQMLDAVLYLTGFPRIQSVRLYEYANIPGSVVEDAALAVLNTETDLTITLEMSWRMHTDKDTVYTHIFGKKGSAFLNPLRINKELHGNLANVTPMLHEQDGLTRYRRAYAEEIQHFGRVIRGLEKNASTADEAARVLEVINALYESGRQNKEMFLD